MNKHLIVVAIAVLLLAVGLSGCESNKVDYQDEAFLEWIGNSANVISFDLRMVSKACKDYDLYSLEYWCGVLEEDTDRYLDEINDFHLFKYTLLTSAKLEYQGALRDFNWAAYYGKRGADSDDIGKSADYLDQGTNHINRCNNIIESISIN